VPDSVVGVTLPYPEDQQLELPPAPRPTVSSAGRPLRAGMRVLDLPGLPPDVEVRASSRRRRTVSAYREGGRTVVLVPARMSRSEVLSYVGELVGRLDARRRCPGPTDAALSARARVLSDRYLQGAAAPTSVRWSDQQRTLWGSCTSAEGTIRLSTRLQTMPAYVQDAVLVHELVHLLVPHHGEQFQSLLAACPRLAEAEAFLAGVSHADSTGGASPD
jgi:hypothetical protein